MDDRRPIIFIRKYGALKTMGNTNASNVQKYGDDPLSVRDTDHYQHEYAKSFVEKRLARKSSMGTAVV